MQRQSRRALWVQTVGVGVFASIAYGIIHDQISVRISPPYLMDWHPTIVASRNPTIVALAWGIAATWWFGLILGIVLAFAATFGKRLPAPMAWIFRSMAFVFVISALAASIALAITRGFSLEMPDLLGPVYRDLARPERLAFTQTLAMHESSYDAAAISTLAAAIFIVWRRKSPPIES